MFLPVQSNHFRILDQYRNFMELLTPRGDRVFVRDVNGQTTEIAIFPVEGLEPQDGSGNFKTEIDGRPILRWSAVATVGGLESQLQAEAPGWDPRHVATKPDWRRLDEEHWAAEIVKVFAANVLWLADQGSTLIGRAPTNGSKPGTVQLRRSEPGTLHIKEVQATASSLPEGETIKELPAPEAVPPSSAPEPYTNSQEIKES